MQSKGLSSVFSNTTVQKHQFFSAQLSSQFNSHPFEGRPFLKEFALKPLCDVDKLQKALLDAGYFAALATEEGYVTFCVTERRTPEEIDGLVKVIKEAAL